MASKPKKLKNKPLHLSKRYKDAPKALDNLPRDPKVRSMMMRKSLAKQGIKPGDRFKGGQPVKKRKKLTYSPKTGKWI